jgi:L-ascorbate metabolism protein UlaG (beta-lactamase superfamily)
MMRKILLLLSIACCSISAIGQQRQTDTFKTPSGKEVKITCIKHASIMMEYDSRYFYFDPVTGLKPETDFSVMPKANYIFITHDHPDHFDRMALTQLVGSNTVVYTNPAVSSYFRNSYAMRNGDSISITDDVQLVAVPAYNTTEGRQQFHPKGRDNGYILILDGLRIYVAGDTEDIPEMANIHNIDIAFLPCNQPYTMTLEQLANAAKTIRPKTLFPYHYSQTSIRKVQLLLNGSGIDVRIRNYQ